MSTSNIIALVSAIVGTVISLGTIVATAWISVYALKKQEREHDKRHNERMRKLDAQLQDSQNRHRDNIILTGYRYKNCSDESIDLLKYSMINPPKASNENTKWSQKFGTD